MFTANSQPSHVQYLKSHSCSGFIRKILGEFANKIRH